MFGIRPPGIYAAWDDLDVMAQADLLAYSQIRQIEEDERHVETLKVIARSPRL